MARKQLGSRIVDGGTSMSFLAGLGVDPTSQPKAEARDSVVDDKFEEILQEKELDPRMNLAILALYEKLKPFEVYQEINHEQLAVLEASGVLDSEYDEMVRDLSDLMFAVYNEFLEQHGKTNLTWDKFNRKHCQTFVELSENRPLIGVALNEVVMSMANRQIIDSVKNGHDPQKIIKKYLGKNPESEFTAHHTLTHASFFGKELQKANYDSVLPEVTTESEDKSEGIFENIRDIRFAPTLKLEDDQEGVSPLYVGLLNDGNSSDVLNVALFVNNEQDPLSLVNFSVGVGSDIVFTGRVSRINCRLCPPGLVTVSLEQALGSRFYAFLRDRILQGINKGYQDGRWYPADEDLETFARRTDGSVLRRATHLEIISALRKFGAQPDRMTPNGEMLLELNDIIQTVPKPRNGLRFLELTDIVRMLKSFGVTKQEDIKRFGELLREPIKTRKRKK